MIALLKGKVADKEAPNIVVIDVNGVGYSVDISMNTFCLLPEIGQEITLFIQQIVREDAHLLYGFANKEEREAFRLLIKVSGIGPKSAIVILSGLTPNELYEIVREDDISRLTKVPGIGKKTAERLILELKDKIKNKLMINDHAQEKISLIEKNNPIDDAVLALVSLGYKQADAEKMVKNIATKEMPVDLIIKQALQKIMKR